MSKRFFYVFVLFLVFLSCKKPSEPVFDSVYDEQSERFIPFAALNTNSVTGVRAQSATSGGQFANDYGKPVTQKGVCWSLVESPTVEGNCSQEGSGLSVFTSTLTNLVADTLYYVRAYATNADGTTYGQQLSFRTLDGKPVFSTPVVSGIGARVASLSGSVSADGGSAILRRGFVWSVNADPTTQDSVRVLGEGLGEMSVALGSLTPDSTYHFRAFAESGTGMHYSVGSSFKTLDGKAVFGQTGVSAITPSTATVSATITGDGGEVITGRGVCYATTQNPTTGDTCVSSGSGTGAFSVTIEELSAETRYYARAYAFNAFRITYSEQMEFNTLDGKAVFGQTRVSSVMASTVSVTVTINSDGGEAITGRGVCYATTQNPTTQDNCVSSGVGTGTFSVTANELSAETRYYIRAYAFNTFRITYSEQMEVTTLDGKAVIGQAGVSDVTGTTAMVSATISSDGGEPITGRGACYATTQNPTTQDTCVSSGSGTGAFAVNIIGLRGETRYYVRAYAFNAFRISYSQQVEFTTSGIAPTVTTGTVSNITTSGATVAGNVTSQGSSAVTARGIVWSTSQNPTVGSNTGITTSGSGTGSFSASLSGLTSGLRYYARAYATNNAGTSYGSQIEFTTSGTAPTVTTGAVSNITTTGASVAGNVTAQGSSTVTARGLCYATTQNPTTANTCVTSGSGTGAFTANLSSLNSGVRYYARAYATNAAGTSYGVQVEFTTLTTGGDANGRDNTTQVVDVRNPATGRTWMDRNLGASRVATSSTDTQAYGDLFQWGRRVDGHQRRTSPTTSALSNTDTPTHGSYIVVTNDPKDWRSPQNNNLWQGVNGVNNPCPVGYRIPSEAEWNAERQSWSSNNGTGAINSPLKLPVAGRRSESNGSIFDVGSSGHYWSSTVNGTDSQRLYFDDSVAELRVGNRALGRSVRCTKNAFETVSPTVTTTSVSSITTNSAVSGGNVTNDGGANVTARGVVWSTSQNPTISSNTGITTATSGTGSFTANLTGLSAGTRYYVRAYATNAAGTSYGSQIEFTTSGTAPTVTTGAVSNITTTGATVAGNVTAQGSSAVSARGVVWSTSQNPTISSNTGSTTSGTGTGSFSASLTGLTSGVRYYARAYATNNAGTSYGSQIEFTTTGMAPTVTTGSVSNITTTGATVAGNVSAQGSSAVTTRGVCYARTQNPTTANTCLAAGSGTGTFSTNLTDLSSGTRYYARAYASNNAGTSYGNQVELTTIATGGDANGRDNTTLVVDVRNPVTGRTWMDRNLGASRVATSPTDNESYGDLYQWGRRADGHQKRNSLTTATLSNTDTPAHGSFIENLNDWRSPQNNNLWQGVNGVNNPCPLGYRIPSIAEWESERESWTDNNSNGAHSSPLRLPMAGLRHGSDGMLLNPGSDGSYWSNSPGENLTINRSSAFRNGSIRTHGLSVRCLKD